MRIIHIVTGLGKASGVTTFVENVVREQRAFGYEVDVLTQADESKLLAGTERCPSVIHIHGLWSPLLHKASVLARRRGIPVVWSTHGMTAPWSMRHKWWKKLPAWWWYQRLDLKCAALIHCTTELEDGWNRKLGFKKTFVAPLGTALPEWKDKKEEELGVGGERNGRTLLFVGRIYPVKALDRLIEAFARVSESVGKDWSLRLVGPDQAGHMAELKELSRRLKIASKVAFAGPKFGQELQDEYANCDALALVSHTENFGATVIDALAHGKPVIASTNTPWKIVADRNCGWWVKNDPEALSEAMSELMTIPETVLSELGKRGRALVEEKYTWPAVGREMCAQYERIMIR